MTYDRLTDAARRMAGEMPVELDLTCAEHLEGVRITADKLLGYDATRDEMERLESDLAGRRNDIPLMMHLALKIARSKLAIASIDEETFVSVIFAIYKEQNRILPRSGHPHGEDFLRRKIDQLDWLFAGSPHFAWEMVLVDDGCPEGSGQIARQILESEGENHPVEVLFLEEGIRRGEPVTSPMRTTEESRKGGSIAYGMWHVVQRRRSNHVVIYTDADLSTHLGQAGLLVEPVIRHRVDAAIGSRREETSIVVKKGKRNDRGKLFIYLWKRILPQLNSVVDTQCGFKAFSAATVRSIVDNLIEKGFAFDIELLLKTILRRPGSIDRVPIAWIDSEAESTTTDLSPYLSMLGQLVSIYRAYLPAEDEPDQFARFIESLDEGKWESLVAHLPAEITSRDPARFADWNEVRPADLTRALQQE